MTSAVQTPEDYGVLTGFQTVSAVDVRRFRDMLGMAEGARHEGGQPGPGPSRSRRRRRPRSVWWRPPLCARLPTC